MRPVHNSGRFADALQPVVFPAVLVFRVGNYTPASGRSFMGPRSTRKQLAERRVKLNFISGVSGKIKMQKLSTSRMNFVRCVLQYLCLVPSLKHGFLQFVFAIRFAKWFSEARS